MSIHRPPWRTLFLVLFLLVVATAGAAEELVFAVTLIRHGDRSPYAKLEGSVLPDDWPDGIGELTPEGMRQELDLGRRMRQRYVDTLGLLPAHYRPNAVAVLSTSANRTVMSAQCFLAGLYPDGTGPRMDNGAPALPGLRQPVPIMTIPRGVPNLINPEHENADKVQELIVRHGFVQPEWQRMERDLAGDLRRWGRILGVPIKDLNAFLVPADHVYCRWVHGKPLPKDLRKADLDRIIATKMRACAIRFVPKELARHMASGFLRALDADLQAVAAGKGKVRYQLYSGHDDSILGLMSALDRPLENNPPYASHVEFELYRDGDAFQVRTFFNGTPVPLTPGNRETLSLAEFHEFLGPYLETGHAGGPEATAH